MLTRTKTTKRAEYENVYGKKTQRKHSELKALDEMLHKTKTLTTIAR